MTFDWKTKLQRMRTLKRGWDGYDALPLDSEAIDLSRYFLTALYPSLELLTKVSPSVNGSIFLTFKKDGRTVYLEVSRECVAVAMFCADGKIETEPVDDDYGGRKRFHENVITFLNGEQS